MNIKLKRIVLARHYGFCMGVKRAIKIAEETGRGRSNPVNVIHEIVHNDAVVSRLAEQGVGHVLSVGEADGGTVIISAHGQPPSTYEQARRQGLEIVDATCPVVIRIHDIIHKLVDNGYQVIHFGDLHHDETRGVVGQAPAGRVIVVGSVEELRRLDRDGRKLALTSQTTAEAEEFERIGREAKRLFPGLEIHNTICKATAKRQAAVRSLAPRVDIVFVVGSDSSANSKRLQSISEAVCGRAYLINSAAMLRPEWLDGVQTVGLTAGASTPDFLVEEVICRLVGLSGGRAEVIRTPKKSRGRKKSQPKPSAR